MSIKNNEVGFIVRKLYNLIKRDVEKSQAKLGINTVKGINGWAISYFYENFNKDIFQKDFEEKFSIRRSTASKILKRMEEKGYIERLSVTKDARLKKIVLTESAIEMHRRITQDIENREKRLRNGIDEQELKVFFQVMKKFLANMENVYD